MPKKKRRCRGVSRNRDSYDELRKLDVPLDTEPADQLSIPRCRARSRKGNSTRNAKLDRRARPHVPVQPTSKISRSSR